MLRRLTFTGVVGAAVLGWAAPALAHVTVAPPSADKGATDVQLSFRVPSEEDSATTRVEIALPSDPPLVGVLAQPVPGWTAKVTTQHLDTPIQTDDGPDGRIGEQRQRQREGRRRHREDDRHHRDHPLGARADRRRRRLCDAKAFRELGATRSPIAL